jgi:hypothetical protein
MNTHVSNTFRASLICLILPGLALAQYDGGTPHPEDFESLYPGKAYSPWAERSFPSRVYWGETHLHTGLSLDAGLFGNTTGHDTAYRLARGEQVTSAGGLPVKLSRPLDFLVITDHSDMMGIATDIQSGAPNILAVPKGKEWAAGFEKGGQAAAEAAFDLIGNFAQGTVPIELLEQYSPGSTIYDNIWDEIVEAAETYNEPGRFTAFIGFEWTSVPKGFNLHRNVILRDDGDRAEQVLPMTTLPPVGSTDPLDLYKWLEDYEAKTGGRALAIAHNGNLSNGWMFPVDKTYAGGRVNKEYVTLRAKWEPLYEATQIKGDGEAHPALSPDDEFADYGTWDVGNLDISELKTPDMLSREYAREALKQGLALEKKFGINPYKFGMVGATDAHTSLTTAEEDNFFGKSTSVEPSATRVAHPFVKSALGAFEGDALLASGYQGIWATENTRKALFDAMERKETYATTGTRILVRFFGGWDFIMVIALRDPIGANLDRIQVVKGWMDDGGDLHEKVYDVTWSGDREPGADGKLPPVGNTVDIEAANWTNTIGASELMTTWSDPDFDADESAFYYVRVLEIPTPRWVLYDKVRLGAHVPEHVELVHQERAYTSPIWYTP